MSAIRHIRRFVLPALIALGASALPGCGRPRGPWSSVVLITVDTLRADHLGCYGYASDTSPNLDALAERGAFFGRCIVPIPRTTQSLASILTAKNPVQHGVRSLGHDLAPRNVTIARRFQEAGFATGAFVELPYFTTPKGFDQGFDRFEFFPQAGGGLVRAEKLADSGIEWLRQQRGDPFFLWLHFRDPHAPYYPPGDEYFHYWPVDPEGRPVGGRITPAMQKRKGLVKFGLERLAPAEVERAVRLYDAEISYTDRHIGRVLEALAEAGLDERTVVAVTADHGESLGEHDFWFDHGEFLFDTCLHVPLIVAAPGRAPVKVPAQVGVIDIAATLIDMFGLEPLADAEGRSFLPAIDGKEFRGRALFAESGQPLMWQQNPRFGGSRPVDPEDRLRAFALEGGGKLVFDPRAPEERRFQLFLTGEDPGETRNLVEDPRFRTKLDSLKNALRRLAAEGEWYAGGDDADELRRMAEQGYLGGAGPPGSSGEERPGQQRR